MSSAVLAAVGVVLVAAPFDLKDRSAASATDGSIRVLRRSGFAPPGFSPIGVSRSWVYTPEQVSLSYPGNPPSLNLNPVAAMPAPDPGPAFQPGTMQPLPVRMTLVGYAPDYRPLR